MKTFVKYFLLLFIILLTFTSFTVINDVEEVIVKPFVIMIDPGHGGKDSGTPGTGRYKATEKDIALDVSLMLGQKIQKELPNVKVVYTRKTDVFPTLRSRPIAARNKEADLFISIHCNAQPGKKGTANGSETFVLGLSKSKTNLEVAKRENSVILLEENYEERYESFDPNSPESLIGLIIMQEDYLDQSIQLARYIEDEFIGTAKRRSRGVKQAGFWVLAQTSMPSVLVELGFLTHKKEEDFLNSESGKKLMTQSLFNAVKKYVENQNAVAVEETNEIEVAETSDDEIFPAITFMVQIAASSRDLELKSFNFKGLEQVTKSKIGKIYRYYYGNTSNYTLIQKLKEEAISKGYSNCFIVSFKNEEQIPLNKALKGS